MYEPKAIIFDSNTTEDDMSKEPHKVGAIDFGHDKGKKSPSGPSALDFSNIPSKPQNKAKTRNSGPSALDFSGIKPERKEKGSRREKSKLITPGPKVSRRERPRNTEASPSAIFTTDVVTPLGRKALVNAKSRFKDVVAKDEEKFIRMLKAFQPVELTKVINWFEPELQEQARLTRAITERIKRFSIIDGASVMDEILSLINGKGGFFSRLFNGESDPNRVKSRVISIRQQLMSIIEDSNGERQHVVKLGEKMALGLAVLSSVHDAMSPLTDDVLDHALFTRREILSTSLSQIMMMPSQLDSLLRESTDLVSRSDQLINVTIPAWTLTNA